MSATPRRGRAVDARGPQWDTMPTPVVDGRRTAVSARRYPTTPDDLVIGVAIEVPDPFGAELTAWRARFGDQREGGIPAHITVLPPTALHALALVDVEEHLLRAARPVSPFTVRLAGTGSFRPVSPVTFVSVTEGAEHCHELQRRVRTGPLMRDLSFEYHPHVTVAQELDDSRLDEAAGVLADWHCEFLVDHLTLYRQHGESWSSAAEIKLRGH